MHRLQISHAQTLQGMLTQELIDPSHPGDADISAACFLNTRKHTYARYSVGAWVRTHIRGMKQSVRLPLRQQVSTMQQISTQHGTSVFIS